MELKNYYRKQLQASEQICGRIKTKILHVSLLRIILFIGGFIALCLFYDKGGVVVGSILAGTFIPFLLLVKLHNRLFQQKEWQETACKLYQDELAAQDNDYSAFDGGKEWIDGSHPYTMDLDIFGKHSLFQALNRTCTSFGKEALGNWLRRHSTDKEEIESRQQAVKELSGYAEFRERFQITGMTFKNNPAEMEDLKHWVNAPTSFLQKRACRWICWAVPSINAILLLLACIGIISFNWFSFAFSCFLIASFGLFKRITAVQDEYNRTLKVTSTYAQLIQMADQQKMDAPTLVALKNELEGKGEKATEILAQLSKELDRLDLRNNQILYVLLEGSMFWQLRQMLRIEQWKEEHGKYLIQWLEALGRLDALCSLGTFAFNHPEYTYPAISQTPFIFHAKNMGHPLMPRRQCVTNDADIPLRPYFLIVTGANMAGKSTYLRTIGCNYLLACIGAPVCCESLEIYPAHLMTSLRTSDSLIDNESYFFAELKRLQQIINRLNEGEVMFIILDEILKGTNSVDKQKGSYALVQQLLHLKANGIIAIHDLLLGKLIQHFPNNIRNLCFEADIQNDELTFSYKLRDGIAKNMNACFLMKKMGITIND